MPRPPQTTPPAGAGLQIVSVTDRWRETKRPHAAQMHVGFAAIDNNERRAANGVMQCSRVVRRAAWPPPPPSAKTTVHGHLPTAASRRSLPPSARDTSSFHSYTRAGPTRTAFRYTRASKYTFHHKRVETTSRKNSCVV